MDSADGALTSVARTLDESTNLTKTEVVSDLCTVFCSHLCCIRSVLLGTAESHLTCRRPRDNLTFVVCQRYDDIIERAVYVQLSQCLYSYVSFLRCC